MERERLTKRVVTAASEKEREPKRKKEEGLHRDLDGFDYDKSKAKILKSCLHNMNVALGTLVAAMKDLAILRGSDITPDGKIGGRGFIMEFREIKSILSRTIDDLSNVTDSIADELTNPKWELKEKEVKTVEKEQEIIEEKKEQVEDIVKDEKEPPVSSQELVQDKDEKGKVFEEVMQGEGESEIRPEDVRDASFFNKYHEMLEGKAPDRVASVLSKRVLANITLKNK